MTIDNVHLRRRRAFWLFSTYGAVMLLLLLRIGHLQVARHDIFLQQSDQNRLRPQVRQPTRGRVYDRNNQIIVDNRPSWTVSVTPVAIARQDSVVQLLAEILVMDAETINERLETRRGHRYAPVPVMRDVPFEVVAKLRERGPDLPGVSIEMEARRRYPFGTMAAHVLGTLREIDEIELSERQRRQEDYLFGDLVGKEGLERVYERTLRGIKGVRFVEVDARGRTVREAREQESRAPEHGSALHTTLDAHLQLIAESAFHDTARGAVVAIDPDDGALLVLASIPGFDPLDFSGVLDAETWDRLRSDERNPLLNRAIAGLYPPASTTKMLTTIAGLQEGVITPTTKLDPCVPGGWRLGNRAFQCWKEGHGSLTVADALEQSCDVFFYQVGIALGLAPLHQRAISFGVSGTTRIELAHEVPGSFPDAAWYDRRLGEGGWHESSQVINLAIGQGEALATPLQVAVMTAALANGGMRVTPYIARFAELNDGSPLRPIGHAPPEPIEGLDPEALAIAVEGMTRVVNGENGTASYLAPRVPNARVAGKTGTGQNPHGENHAWFTCFAPVDSPEIVVTVLVENGGGGSAVAAPIAFQVLRAYFSDRPPGATGIVGERPGR